MKIVLFLVGCAPVALTLLSLVRSAQWWVRFADFPRLQIATALAVVIAGFLFVFDPGSAVDIVFLAVCVGCLGYQCLRILPYTPLWGEEVLRAEPVDPQNSIRLLISNLLMENRQSEDLLARVREHDPDLILVAEANDWWNERLRVLDEDYPYSVKRPQENYYGMLLFSKLELGSPELRFLVEEDVPSIRTSVRLRSGSSIEFYGVHPRPPEPDNDTDERDAEILIVGKQLVDDGRPSIVAGDLNDVAWSDTTRLFQRISGMLDPRRGRGMYSTFHADWPIFRWPLDHVFADSSFTLVRLHRLRSIGSDHFPVLAEFCHKPAAAARQEPDEADADEREEAEAKIKDGHEAAG